MQKTIVCASLCAAIALAQDPTPNAADQAAWEQFKVQYDKKYHTKAAEDERFGIFVGNLRRAEEQTKNEPHAEFGVTKFSDLTQDEFRARLGYVRSDVPRKASVAPKVQVNGVLPDSIDWTGRATTPVKDQGSCGSCWAFSATEQIESDFMLQKNVTMVLGVQEFVDCTASGLPRLGCLGGNTEDAYKVAEKLGGMELEKDYPYRGLLAIPVCHLNTRKLAVTLDDWAYVGKGDETEMKKYVGTSGTLSVCVDAGRWDSYKSGVMTNCKGRDVDHCVQIVGYGKTDKGLEYWKVRNSWNTDWGEKGFIRLALGTNQCDINSEATKTTAGKVLKPGPPAPPAPTPPAPSPPTPPAPSPPAPTPSPPAPTPSPPAPTPSPPGPTPAPPPAPTPAPTGHHYQKRPCQPDEQIVQFSGVHGYACAASCDSVSDCPTDGVPGGARLTCLGEHCVLQCYTDIDCGPTRCNKDASRNHGYCTYTSDSVATIV